MQQATLDLAAGRPRHLALFGLRRIGKTLLLLEHAARVLEGPSGASVRPVYLDLEELVTSPELFSRRYVGLVTFWVLTGGQGDVESFLTPTGLLGGSGAGLRCVAQTLVALEPDDVSRAFILDALNRTGQIYTYCRYLYDISLRRARGYGILKAILQVLAEEEGLSLSELARRIRKGASATRGHLRALQEVDLVLEDDGEYFYRDPVLRYWVGAMVRGIEVDALAGRAALAPLLADLEAEHSRLTTEMGQAREAVVREMLRSFAGQTVDGTCFRRSGPFRLPAFRAVAPHRSPDGRVEVDALAENGERWAVEVKWRGRAAGEKELVAFHNKAQALSARPWFISRGGFTPAALTYAAAQDVVVSTRADLEKLEQTLRKAAE